ncbi:uncharacterized protein LOC144110496 [Amblyomma americanum]
MLLTSEVGVCLKGNPEAVRRLTEGTQQEIRNDGMEKLGVIVICVLAGMTYARGGIQVGQGSSEMPQEIKALLQRVNPWNVVNNSNPVYLTKLSGENSLFQSLMCVWSKYLRYKYDNKTTYRTLQATLINTPVAVNISLQVQPPTEVYPPTLIVHVLHYTYGLLPSCGLNDFVALGKYELPVLYGDGKCLILGNSKLQGPDSAGCFMWMPKNYLTKPPFCCEFIYFLLCGAKITDHDKAKCSTPSVTSATSNS